MYSELYIYINILKSVSYMNKFFTRGTRTSQQQRIDNIAIYTLYMLL